MLLEGVQPIQNSHEMPIAPLRGLLDTGAQGTLITKKAAANVGLRPRGKKRIGNVSSSQMHTAYSFVVGVWYEANGYRGYYGFDPILGADFKDNEDFDLLVGMDIISQGDFFTRRDGTFEWHLP